MWKSCPLTLTRRWTGVTDGDVFGCPKKTTDVGKKGRFFDVFRCFFLILIEVLDV